MKRQLKHGDRIVVSLTAVELEFVESNSQDSAHTMGTNFGQLRLVQSLTEIAESDKMIVHPNGGQLANGGILATTKTDGTINPGSEETDLDGEADDRFFFVYAVDTNKAVSSKEDRK